MTKLILKKAKNEFKNGKCAHTDFETHYYTLKKHFGINFRGSYINTASIKNYFYKIKI